MAVRKPPATIATASHSIPAILGWSVIRPRANTKHATSAASTLMDSRWSAGKPTKFQPKLTGSSVDAPIRTIAQAVPGLSRQNSSSVSGIQASSAIGANALGVSNGSP